jgi:hypothetical protein
MVVFPPNLDNLLRECAVKIQWINYIYCQLMLFKLNWAITYFDEKNPPVIHSGTAAGSKKLAADIVHLVACIQ